MKIAACSVSYEEVHTLETVQRHALDWRLQTNQNFKLTIYHDGPYSSRERLAPIDIDFGPNIEVLESSERRRFWGAFNRKDWLESLDPEEFEFVFFCAADDQICPIMVERVLQEFERAPELASVMFQTPHHHYTYGLIPLGVGPYVNRADWSSGVVRTKIAKEAGINFPEDFAADGMYWQDCLRVSGGDDNLFRVLHSCLVFKN